MKSNNSFVTFIVVLFLAGACLLSLVIIRSIVEPMIHENREIALVKAQKAEPETSEERAVGSLEHVAAAGFAANASIAASGDMAQASMVRSFSSAIWAIMGTIAVVVVAFVYLSTHPDRSSSKITARDFEEQHRNL